MEEPYWWNTLLIVLTDICKIEEDMVKMMIIDILERVMNAIKEDILQNTVYKI